LSGTRITRKQMKSDELVNTVSSLTAVAERHARSIIIAVAAVIALGLAVGGGFWYSRTRENAAITELAAVQTAVSAPVAGEVAAPAPGATAYLSSEQKYQEVLRRADVVLAEYPSSTAAGWATYWKAYALNELSRREEALAALEPLAGGSSDPFLSASARMLQARVHEAEGDLASALDIYASLAASAPPRFPAELCLMSQARILEAQGRNEEATQMYRRVTQEYPDSPFAREASRHLGEGRI